MKPADDDLVRDADWNILGTNPEEADQIRDQLRTQTHTSADTHRFGPLAAISERLRRNT